MKRGAPCPHFLSRPPPPVRGIHALQRVAACCSVLQRVATSGPLLALRGMSVCCSLVQCGTVCCSVLQSVAECCSVLQRVAAYCSRIVCIVLCGASLDLARPLPLVSLSFPPSLLLFFFPLSLSLSFSRSLCLALSFSRALVLARSLLLAFSCATGRQGKDNLGKGTRQNEAPAKGKPLKPTGGVLIHTHPHTYTHTHFKDLAAKGTSCPPRWCEETETTPQDLLWQQQRRHRQRRQTHTSGRKAHGHRRRRRTTRGCSARWEHQYIEEGGSCRCQGRRHKR